MASVASSKVSRERDSYALCPVPKPNEKAPLFVPPIAFVRVANPPYALYLSSSSSEESSSTPSKSLAIPVLPMISRSQSRWRLRDSRFRVPRPRVLLHRSRGPARRSLRPPTPERFTLCALALTSSLSSLSSVSAAASAGFLPPDGVPRPRGERSALGDRRASPSSRACVEANEPEVEGTPDWPRSDTQGDAVDAIASRPPRAAEAARAP
mmetsp:Transcript_7472/g.31841  ORF Transcript_7472/g.31841 Transcript_7472/m.31841 type:complete len:210 (+) Transcript_7472:3128-3757(+)